MARTMIEIFNTAISDAVDKSDDFYQTWIGETPFTPATQVLQSADVNCGAVCNELEFGRDITQYFVRALDIDQAEDDELSILINGFIDLPRRGNFESDDVFRNRYKFLVMDQANPRRTTKWSILDALRYFIDDVGQAVQIVEVFDTDNLYFQVRIEGIQSTTNVIFLNNLSTAWLDQNFLGGPSLGAVITYIGELIDRVKAAGVDYDVMFISQDRFNKTSDAFIGSVQIYKTSISRIKASISFTSTADARIA